MTVTWLLADSHIAAAAHEAGSAAEEAATRKSVKYSNIQAHHIFQPFSSWGLSAGYQPRPQVVDRGTTARYGGQLRYI